MVEIRVDNGILVVAVAPGRQVQLTQPMVE
jgi:hypothetical protein